MDGGGGGYNKFVMGLCSGTFVTVYIAAIATGKLTTD